MAIDVQRLIGEIAARNHVLVEHDDPIFAVTTINRLMLDDAVEALVARVRTTITEFEASARAVDSRAGKLLAEEVRRATAAAKAEIADDLKNANIRACELINEVHLAHSRPEMLRWGVIGMVAGLLFFGCGTLFAIFIR